MPGIGIDDSCILLSPPAAGVSSSRTYLGASYLSRSFSTSHSCADRGKGRAVCVRAGNAQCSRETTSRC
eukprot:4373850-Prymnesium_polylepis.1